MLLQEESAFLDAHTQVKKKETGKPTYPGQGLLPSQTAQNEFNNPENRGIKEKKWRGGLGRVLKMGENPLSEPKKRGFWVSFQREDGRSIYQTEEKKQKEEEEKLMLHD